MNRLILPILVLLFLSISSPSFAQDVKIPDGMESIEVSDGFKMLVPKGAKVTKTGGQITVEDTGEYLIRKFNKLESRFKKIENNQKTIQSTLKDLETGSNLTTQASSISNSAVLNLQKKQTELLKDVKVLKKAVTDINTKLPNVQLLGSVPGEEEAKEKPEASKVTPITPQKK